MRKKKFESPDIIVYLVSTRQIFAASFSETGAAGLSLELNEEDMYEFE